MIMTGMGLAAITGLVGKATVKRTFSTLRPNHLRAQVLIAAGSAVTWYANIIALKHLPLTIFYIAVFTAPLTISGLSSFLKHEVLSPTKIACLIAGFMGVILAIAPRIENNSGELIGYIAASISVAAFAFNTVTLRKIAQTDTPESIQLLCSLSVSSIGILGILSQNTQSPDGKALALIVGAGLINLIGNLLYNTALKHTTSSNVAQLHYTQLISGALLGYLLWHEIPTWNLVAGAIIIIAAGLIVAAQAHSTQAAP